MSWTAITVSDLKDAKVSTLVDACSAAALGTGQTDPVPNIIANVIARIRAEIAGCASNSLDADTTTIPTDLKSLACRMIMREAMSRLRKSLNEDEREEQRNDLKYLERIARGDVPVAAPDNPLITEEVQSTSGTPRLTARTRHFGREYEDGV
jgi:phage gp36-like protein